MTLEEFKSMLSQTAPPPGLSNALLAMWYDGKDNWEKAHNIAQDIGTADGSWIHAYLHRKEGDESNASYWYRRAGKRKPAVSLEQEWEEIAEALLKEQG